MFIALDEEIHNTFQKDNRGSTTDGLAGIFEPFGNGAFTIPTLAAFYILGHFHEDEKAKRTTLIATGKFSHYWFIYNSAQSFVWTRIGPIIQIQIRTILHMQF